VIWQDEDPISGERLQALAEVSVATPSVLAFHTSLPAAGVRECAVFPDDADGFGSDAASIERLRSSRSIFVYTHLVQSFAKHVLPSLRNRFVLISHNSDRAVDGRFSSLLDDPRLVHWFAQNVAMSHPKLSPIPIGLANAQWPHGRIADVLTAAASAPPVRRRIVYCNFNVKTDYWTRAPLRWRLVLKPGVWQAPHKPFREYLVDLAQCRWCVSPPGNGLDCHRTWEALYLGVVPVVRRIQGLEDVFAGLPVVQLDRLGALSLRTLEAEQSRRAGMSFELSRLTMDYWRKRIAEKVASI